jgi:hypothetical protein
VNLRSSEDHPRRFTAAVGSSIPNSSRGRKILSVRLRQSFFLAARDLRLELIEPTLSRSWFIGDLSPNIGVMRAGRFSIVRDLPADFRPDSCAE